MYERFSGRGRRVMQFANEEAYRFASEWVGTEHLLLGLVDLRAGVASTVLKNLGVGAINIRQAVEQIIQPEPGTVRKVTYPPTRSTKKVIEFAMCEARNLNHDYVGTEHILLGLLRQQEGVAAQVLMGLGLTIDEARREIVKIHDEASQNTDRSKISDERSNAPSDALSDALSDATPQATCETMKASEPCSTCGLPMTRVLGGWRTSWLEPPERAAIEAGVAILGPSARGRAPAQVCRACVPLWWEFHLLALRDYEWQMEKCAAVDAAEFERAATILDQQLEIRPRIEELLQRLTGS